MKRTFAAALLLFLSFASWAANEWAFAPSGPTVLVDTTPRQVISTSGVPTTSYRVRNLGNVQAYFTWVTPSTAAGTPSGLSAAAPTAGVPATNVIGMLPQSVETFTLPANAWFQAGSAFTFEVTPGDGR